MNTLQILCTLRDVKSILGVFPSDLLPRTITRPGTIIVNCDPHTEDVSHWLAINFQPKSCSGFYFDSYGLRPYIPSILSLLKRTCVVWNFNTVQLQGLTSTVCGHYCCLFALYLDKGYSPKQFTSLFDTRTADRQVAQMFASEFPRSLSIRERSPSSRGVQCCTCYTKRYV
jgi:hypothetical protein